MTSTTRWIVLSAALVLCLLYLSSGFFMVALDEQALVLRFGAKSRVVTSGLHWRFPWPVEQVYRVAVGKEYPMSIGYRFIDEATGRAADEREMQWLTGDTNLIDIQLYIRYRVKDLAEFLFATEEPRFLVRRAAESALTEEVGRLPVDRLLTFGKSMLAQDIEQQTQRMLDRWKAGIMIVAVEVRALEAPQQVRFEFREVTSAEQESSRARVEAEGYRQDLLMKTRGEREQILAEAEGAYQTRVAQASASAERFEQLLAEYRQSPRVVRRKLYYETMKFILPNISVTILPPGKTGTPKIDVIERGR